MYYINIYKNYLTTDWEVSVEELQIVEELENVFVIQENDEVDLRSNMVYKNDEDDVLSCGYAVLDTPMACLISEFESYGCCVTFDKSKGLELIKETLNDIINKKTAKLNSLSNELKKLKL